MPLQVLPHQRRGSTRIIWNLPSTHLHSHATHIFSAGTDSLAHGLCIDSFLAEGSPELCLKFLCAMQKQYGHGAMPALMLSLTTGDHSVTSSMPLTLCSGDSVYVVEGEVPSTAPSTTYSACIGVSRVEKDIAVGENLYFGYGDCVMKVVQVHSKDKAVSAEVIFGGVIEEGMSVHFASHREDMGDPFQSFSLEDFLAVGVNYLVLPGAMSVSAVGSLRKMLPRHKENSPWLIYRIDSSAALAEFAQLEDYIDGVMISRRELALSENPDMIPIITKELIARCAHKAKLTIVASHMLGSMQRNITPTRAEVSDIAGAVHDGADAIMLPQNTLIGPYGLQATQVARVVIHDVAYDDSLKYSWQMDDADMEMDVICTEAAKTAIRIGAKALVCITKTGNTALRLSSIDVRLPIIAITFHDIIRRKLKVLRGVKSLVLKSNPGVDEVLPRVNELVKTMGWLHKGDKIVFVTVTLSSMSQEASNLFTIQSIY